MESFEYKICVHIYEAASCCTHSITKQVGAHLNNNDIIMCFDCGAKFVYYDRKFTCTSDRPYILCDSNAFTRDYHPSTTFESVCPVGEPVLPNVRHAIGSNLRLMSRGMKDKPLMQNIVIAARELTTTQGVFIEWRTNSSS